MSGRVKKGVMSITDIVKELYKTYYFIFMVGDRDVAEAWIKAGVTNAIDRYIDDDWRKYFEEVTVDEFAEETKVLSNVLLLPSVINGKPIRRGVIITKEPFAVLVLSDVNVAGFIIENYGDYEMHYLLFSGFDIMTQESKKILIKTRALSNGGMLYRITSD